MKVELIYLNENKCSNLENLLLKISPEPLLCLTKTSKDDFLETLDEAFTRSELIVTVGGFYSGSFHLPKLIIEQYELTGTVHKTTRENFFNDEPQGGFVLPSNALPLYDDNGTIFAAVIESEQQKMILLSESLSEGEYSYADEVEAYLEKVNLLSRVIPLADNLKIYEQEKKTIENTGSIATAKAVTTEEAVITQDDIIIDYTARKKLKLKAIIIALIAVIFAVAGFFGLNYFSAFGAYDDQNRALSLEYGQVVAGVPTEILDKFGALYKQNSDIGGWMIVPNTQISYPVMLAPKNNSTYYSNHLFSGKSNKFGTPYFSDNYKKNDFNFNSVIYGNNFGDSRAFSELQKYISLSFYKTAPLITLDTIYTENDWKVFSVIITDLNDKSFFR